MAIVDSIFRLWQIFWNWLVSSWQSRFGPVLTMDDSGMRVRIGSQIAEGGFSVIFHATDIDARTRTRTRTRTHSATISSTTNTRTSNTNTNTNTNDANQKYVLKRIRCHDGETRSGCLKESKVHYAIMMRQQQQQQQQKNNNNNQQHSSSHIIAAGGGTRVGVGGMSSSRTTIETIRDSLSGHVMPLLGMTFCENNTVCYMLFPYLPHSLRREVDRRIFEPLEEVVGNNNNKNKNGSTMSQTQKNQKIKDALRMPPWSETTVLRWFEQLCEAVILMHDAGYTHRDIKLDNVLLYPGAPPPPMINNNNNVYGGGGGGGNDARSGLVLMDYGSAGSLTRSLATRRDVLEIADEASQHTTISYRPPELFAGELRVAASPGSSNSIANNNTNLTNDIDIDIDGDGDGNEVVDHESVLDYRKVDTWMLGCTLFAILFGVSPGECEFSRSTGQLLIVDPTHNKVLGKMPPWPNDETPSSRWYSSDAKQLLEWILTKDRGDRPTVKQVRRRVRELLSQKPTLFVEGDNGTTTTTMMMMMDVESQVMDIR